MMIEMVVSSITIDPFTNMPIVILKDKEEKKILPIWIGFLEAGSIVTELEKIVLPRPMTHDLIKNILEALNIRIERVEITDLQDNTYFARLYVMMGGKTLSIDSRPSDAIAIALRTNSPIFVSEKVIETSKKIKMEIVEEKTDKEKFTEILEKMGPEDFGKYKM